MRNNENNPPRREFSFARAFVTSLISTFFFMVSLIFSIFLFGTVQSGYMGNPILGIASLMLVLTLCGASLFGPAYYESRNFGWFEGLITLVLSAIIIAGIIILFVFFFMSSGGVHPMMETTMK